MCIELLLTRRSIRRYSAEAVSQEMATQVLTAAMAAPSAGDQQPWQFIVIRERETLLQISRIHPHAGMVAQAGLAILVCGDLGLEKQKGYWVQDCSAATQNLMLAAHALKLGSVWVGIYPREERIGAFRELLGIPEQVVPFSLVPLGHPAEHKEPANRYNPTRIHGERW
jgi:nitroreductase